MSMLCGGRGGGFEGEGEGEGWMGGNDYNLATAFSCVRKKKITKPPPPLATNRLLKRKEGQKSNQMPSATMFLSSFCLLYPYSILETFNHLRIKSWNFDLSQPGRRYQVPVIRVHV